MLFDSLEFKPIQSLLLEPYLSQEAERGAHLQGDEAPAEPGDSSPTRPSQRRYPRLPHPPLRPSRGHRLLQGGQAQQDQKHPILNILRASG